MTIPAIPTFFVAALGLAAAAAPSASAAVLLFDVGAAGTAAVAPNNSIVEATTMLANTTDTTGSATGISVSVTGFNGSNTNGTLAPTGAAAGIFSTVFTQDSLFGNTGLFNTVSRPTATLVFNGLDGSGGTVYTFDFFASRTGVGDIRETEYNLAGASPGVSVLLDASNNTGNIVTSPGIIPTAGGSITLTVDAGPNNNNGTGVDPTRFYYLGAFRLTTAPVPEPSAAGFLLLTGAAALRRRRAAC